MLEDAEIVRRCSEGQIDLIEILIEKYKSQLYKLCLHLTNNKYEAEDLFQDTWVKAVKCIGKCNAEKSFYIWIYTISLNLYRDKYRKEKRWLSKVKEYFDTDQKEELINKFESNYMLPEDNLLQKHEKARLKAVINDLNDKLRIPIILFYFKDMSVDNIAQVLDIPVGTVKSRLNTARNKLKKMMEVENYEEREIR